MMYYTRTTRGSGFASKNDLSISVRYSAKIDVISIINEKVFSKISKDKITGFRVALYIK